MHAVDPRKTLARSANPQMMGEQHDATAAVAAHGRFAAVGIEIAHPEQLPGIVFQQHQPIGADPGAAAAQGGHMRAGNVESARTVIDQHEIIARSVVFIKFLFHIVSGLSVQISRNFQKAFPLSKK